MPDRPPAAPPKPQQPLRERRKLRSRILPGLWLLYMAMCGLGIVTGIGLFWAGSGSDRSSAGVLLAMDGWGFAAGVAFALAVRNPRDWGQTRRLTIGGPALGAMLGRLVGANLVAILLLNLPYPGLFAFFVMPFAMMFGGLALIFALGCVAFFAFTFFVGVPVLLFNQIFFFERQLKIYRYQSNGLAGYIVRAVHWLRKEPLPEPPPDDSKGARFATPDEVTRLSRKGPGAPMAFGHYRGSAIRFATDKHVLIMASTRSGKGVALIVPHLLRYRGSAFVLDPKGENAKATGRRRAELNGEVHYLDPFGISGKPQSRFNPLARFTPSSMEAESKALAAAMFVVGERERDHWTASAQQLLAAFILYVYASDDVPGEAKDLPTVRRLLLGKVAGTLEAMKDMDAADGLLSALATSFLSTPEKEFGSIVSAAQRQTEILDNPFMIACLSATGPGAEVDFKAWRTGTMTVYLCLSAPKFPVFNRWLRLVLTSALDEMTDTMAPPKLPVCFMLDELATLGHLEAVENAVGLAAGYGIQLINVFQDTAQMRDLYKGRWASFIGNAGVRAVFNLDDFDTASYWSKFMGGSLVETRSQQVDIYGYTKGNNVGETMRPLLAPEELMMDFAAERMLVLVQGAHPIVTGRVPYYDDKGLKGLWDDPREPVVAVKSAPSPPEPVPPAPPSTPPAPAPTPQPQAAVKPSPATPENSVVPGPWPPPATSPPRPPAAPPQTPAAAKPPVPAPRGSAIHSSWIEPPTPTFGIKPAPTDK